MFSITYSARQNVFNDTTSLPYMLNVTFVCFSDENIIEVKKGQ